MTIDIDSVVNLYLIYNKCYKQNNNFSNRKYRIRTILEEKELLDYIDEDLETIIKNLNEADDAEISLHAKNDTIGEIFERKTVSGQLFLRKKLLTLKYNERKHIYIGVRYR